MPVNNCCCGATQYRQPRFCDSQTVAFSAMLATAAEAIIGAFTIGEDSTCFYFDFDDDPITDTFGMIIIDPEDITEHDDCEACQPCETTFGHTTEDEYLIIPPASINFGILDVTTCSPSVADVQVSRVIGLFWGDAGGSICLSGALSQNAASQVNLTNTSDGPGQCRYWGVGLNWATATYGTAGASWRRWQSGMNVTGIYWPYATNQPDFPSQTEPLYVEAVLP